jgi:hypothetical protein
VDIHCLLVLQRQVQGDERVEARLGTKGESHERDLFQGMLEALLRFFFFFGSTGD